MLHVHLVNGHLHDDAGARVDGQDGRIAGAALRPEGRADDVHDGVVMRQDVQQRVIEAAGAVIIRRGGELELEAELVEEVLQHVVVVLAEAGELAEGVWDFGERLAKELLQHVLVRHVVRHFAQAVHVVGERQQARRQAGEFGEGLAHPGGAGDLAEGADVGQAGGAVAGFEQSLGLAFLLQARGDTFGFTEGPA